MENNHNQQKFFFFVDYHSKIDHVSMRINTCGYKWTN